MRGKRGYVDHETFRRFVMPYSTVVAGIAERNPAFADLMYRKLDADLVEAGPLELAAA